VADDSPSEPIENIMPNPGPGGRPAPKPVFFVLPRGVSAEEAARLLREMIEKHAGKPAGAAGPDEGGEASK
jgi:hypothetical protein